MTESSDYRRGQVDTKIKEHDEELIRLHSAVESMSKELTTLKIAVNRLALIVIAVSGVYGSKIVFPFFN